MDKPNLSIKSFSEEYSSRFNVKKIVLKVEFIGPNIKAGLDDLIARVVSDPFVHEKIGLSIQSNKCVGIFVVFRNKYDYSGAFLLKRFEKLAQSGFQLFQSECEYRFVFTLLASHKR